MSDNNDAISPDTDNLDDFERLFNGTPADIEPDEGVSDSPSDEDEDAGDDTEEDTDVEDQDVDEEETDDTGDDDDDDSPATDDDDADDSEDDDDSGRKKKKLTARERVEQAVARQREAERERDELMARLERLEQQANKSKEEEDEEPTASKPKKTEDLKDDAPKSDAVDEDGEPLYPLGDLDPKYIRDLTKWSVEQAQKEAQQQREQEERQRQQEEAMTQLTQNWEQKLQQAEKDIPEVRQKGQKLEDTFRNIEPEYGQALAATIMTLDYGPHVIDYLADNLQEAQEIVNSGPLEAALKLGSLNERLSNVYGKPDEGGKSKKKVSKAPPPAPTNRGTKRTKRIAPDTDNLDDFEKLFNQG